MSCVSTVEWILSSPVTAIQDSVQTIIIRHIHSLKTNALHNALFEAESLVAAPCVVYTTWANYYPSMGIFSSIHFKSSQVGNHMVNYPLDIPVGTRINPLILLCSMWEIRFMYVKGVSSSFYFQWGKDLFINGCSQKRMLDYMHIKQWKTRPSIFLITHIPLLVFLTYKLYFK